MSNSTRKKDIRRTPLSQLHNTASISSEKLSFTQDSGMSKQSFNSAPPVSGSENKQEENEYTKVLKKALKEAVDENETLRNRVIELEALLSAAQDEIEEKDKAILELFAIVESQKAKDAKEKGNKSVNNSGSQDENGKENPEKPLSS